MFLNKTCYYCLRRSTCHFFKEDTVHETKYIALDTCHNNRKVTFVNIIFQTRSMFYGVVAVHSCVQDSMTPSHHLLFLLLFIVSHSLTMITSMNEKNECRTAAAVAAPHRGKLEGAMGLPAKAMAKARGRAISLLFIYHISSSFLPREDCQSLITNSTSACC